jgi:hypothetical protein
MLDVLVQDQLLVYVLVITWVNKLEPFSFLLCPGPA